MHFDGVCFLPPRIDKFSVTMITLICVHWTFVNISNWKCITHDSIFRLFFFFFSIHRNPDFVLMVPLFSYSTSDQKLLIGYTLNRTPSHMCCAPHKTLFFSGIFHFCCGFFLVFFETFFFLLNFEKEFRYHSNGIRCWSLTISEMLNHKLFVQWLSLSMDKWLLTCFFFASPFVLF